MVPSIVEDLALIKKNEYPPPQGMIPTIHNDRGGSSRMHERFFIAFFEFKRELANEATFHVIGTGCEHGLRIQKP